MPPLGGSSLCCGCAKAEDGHRGRRASRAKEVDSVMAEVEWALNVDWSRLCVGKGET